jgi:hypothetical protein
MRGPLFEFLHRCPHPQYIPKFPLVPYLSQLPGGF